LFTFPSRYSFTIGHQVVLSLGRWAPQIPSGFLVPQSTQESNWPVRAFVYGGITLYAAPSQVLPLAFPVPYVGPTTPLDRSRMVWAIPRSLATTRGVSVD